MNAFLLIIASAFWGSNIVLMKLLLDNCHFLILIQLKLFVSLIFLSLYMFYKKETFVLEGHTLLKVICISFLCVYFNFICTFYALYELGGGNNALINSLNPLLTSILLFVCMKKKSSRREKIGMLCCFLAFILYIFFNSKVQYNALILLILGNIGFTFGNVLIQKWQFKRSLSLVFYELLLSLLFITIHLFLVDIDYNIQFTISDTILFILISGIGYAFIQSVYFSSIQKIGTLKTSFYLNFNPIFTYLGSLFFLHEKLNIALVVCLIISMIGFFVANMHIFSKNSLTNGENKI